jgi:non-specific serine/threonine protein kinase
MTGTPIENSVMDLWSIFKFLDSTLLGDAKEFIKTISTKDMFKLLVDILEPYVIRRVKTDKTLGLNLPSKIESTVYCELTDEQKVLYNAIIELFEKNVIAAKRLKRRICALSYINLLKRILSDYRAIVCDNDIKYSNCKINAMVGYLREQNKPKSIVFTQYKKTSETIAQELSKLYGSNGLIINGTLSAKKRVEIANKFQTGAYPFIVITLKAGNAGLTLTEAHHVIHFDRWWNPSIENQATDRAYRIGQKEDVHVVKLVTRGTLEERIDSVLKDKMMLFDNVINKLNMTNDELLDFIKYKD